MTQAASIGDAAAPSPGHDHAPCRLPWAPDDCRSLAPCAPAAVVPTTVAALAAPRIGHDALRLVVLAPPSRSTPPELPPPRA